MEPTAKERLVALFEQWSGQQLAALSELPPSGSYRQYYRLSGASVSVLGAINQNIKENRAFLEFSRFFHEKGLRVPEIYAVAFNFPWKEHRSSPYHPLVVGGDTPQSGLFQVLSIVVQQQYISLFYNDNGCGTYTP